MADKDAENLIKNGDFLNGELGALPEGWKMKSLFDNLDPVFRLTLFEGKPAVEVYGDGNENCIGHLQTPVKLKRGETYKMKTLFHITEDINPQSHLMFSFYAAKFEDFNNGIFNFERLQDGWVLGENDFFVSGEGDYDGSVWITFRLNATGKVHIREISLKRTEPIPARPVKVACSVGKPAPGTWHEHWENAFSKIKGRNFDLFLLPEVFNDCIIESDDGPAIQFMSQQAKHHKMYVAGSILYKDPKDGFVYNSCLMYNREGQLCARYDKNHPFSNEFANMGVIPGYNVPVFDTDFGKVGILICYDSWFSDVAELLGLKGAEIVLFPNAGYYRSLLPARAADNCIRIISSSLDNDCGIWDTSGADVTNPNIDPTRHSKNDRTFSDVVVEHFGEIKILSCTLDLSQSPSPHNWGGPLMSAPGGRRNRREQRKLLYEEIEREVNRWWN